MINLNEIKPIKVRDLPDFLRTLKPLMAYLADGNISGALLNEPDALIKAVAICSRIPLDEVQELEVDELMQIAAQVIEVNADFFMQKVMPVLSQFANRLTLKQPLQNP